MKFGLFASKDVGLRIAQFLSRSGNIPMCLVLDAKGDKENNNQIIAASGVTPENVFYSDSVTPYLLKKYDLDLIFLVWWPYIIKKDLIEIPRLGVLNTHYSYLPFHRGKHANFWTFIDGEPFGATIHFVNEDIDAGDIAFQRHIEKTWEDTGETLYQKVRDAVVDLFIENFPVITSGKIPRRDQAYWSDIVRASYHNSNEIELASEIRLCRYYQGKELLNLIRARTFPPYPAAWFYDNGQKYEVRVTITKAT